MVFSFLFGKKEKRCEISSDVIDDVLFPFLQVREIARFSTGINHRLTNYHYEWLMLRDFKIHSISTDPLVEYRIASMSQYSTLNFFIEVVGMNIGSIQYFPLNGSGDECDLSKIAKMKDNRLVIFRRIVALFFSLGTKFNNEINFFYNGNMSTMLYTVAETKKRGQLEIFELMFCNNSGDRIENYLKYNSIIN